MKASLKRSPSSVKPLLLICCHTDQKALVDHVEAELRHAGYAVWNTAALSRTEASHAHSHARAEKSVSFCVGVGKEFLAKVDEAACVIFVLSASFAKSIVCQQQVGRMRQPATLRWPMEVVCSRSIIANIEKSW